MILYYINKKLGIYFIFMCFGTMKFRFGIESNILVLEREFKKRLEFNEI